MVSKQAGTPKVAQCSHTTPIYSDASVVTTYNESGLKYKMEKKRYMMPVLDMSPPTVTEKLPEDKPTVYDDQ